MVTTEEAANALQRAKRYVDKPPAKIRALAQVRMTIVRQVEIEIDEHTAVWEIREQAMSAARKKYGDADSFIVDQVEVVNA